MVAVYETKIEKKILRIKTEMTDVSHRRKIEKKLCDFITKLMFRDFFMPFCKNFVSTTWYSVYGR